MTPPVSLPGCVPLRHRASPFAAARQADAVARARPMLGGMSSWMRGVVVAGCAAAACGKVEHRSGAPDAAGDDGGDDDGDGTLDGGGGEDAGPALDKTGLVYVFAQNYTQDGSLVLTSTATARFGAVETEDCEVELAGSECRVLACRPRAPVSPLPAAGNITIEGLDSYALEPSNDGSYPVESVEGVIFSDGSSVSALATGGEVPEFAIEELVAPYSIGFQGAPSSDAPTPLSASADYELVWGGIAASDQVRIDIAAPPGGDGVRRRIACALLAGNGALVIPSEALARLPLGELLFEARVETSRSITAGDYEVTLTAAVVARVGDDATFDWARGAIVLGR